MDQDSRTNHKKLQRKITQALNSVNQNRDNCKQKLHTTENTLHVVLKLLKDETGLIIFFFTQTMKFY